MESIVILVARQSLIMLVFGAAILLLTRHRCLSRFSRLLCVVVLLQGWLLVQIPTAGQFDLSQTAVEPHVDSDINSPAVVVSLTDTNTASPVNAIHPETHAEPSLLPVPSPHVLKTVVNRLFTVWISGLVVVIAISLIG